MSSTEEWVRGNWEILNGWSPSVGALSWGTGLSSAPRMAGTCIYRLPPCSLLPTRGSYPVGSAHREEEERVK